MPSKDEFKNFYRPELDSLRFFAFLLVFLSHSHRFVPLGLFSPRVASVIDSTLTTGSWGVDLFFVLSAYLITELLRREKEATDTIRIGWFYTRRILRIWPLYFLAIGIGYLAQFVWSTEHLPLNYVFWFVFLGGNWVSALHGLPHTIIAPLWSVSIEEQFYLSWPWVMRRMSLRWVGNTALLLLIVPNAARLYLVSRHSSSEMFWCNTFGRIDAILIGILLSLWLKGHIPKWPQLARVVVFITALAGLAVANRVFHVHTLDSASVKNALLGFPVAALLVSAMFLSVLGAAGSKASWLSWPVLTYLGRISYGLYVFHRLSYVMAQSVFGKSGGPRYYCAVVLAGFCFTLALAAISHKFFELPFLDIKRRFTFITSDRAISREQGRSAAAS